MSQSRNVYKWAFVGLLIAVTLIGASLYVNWRFTEMQVNFNKRVAANALSVNSQINFLEEETEVIAEDMDTVMQAIHDLEVWINEDQERQDMELHGLQVQMNNLNSRIDSTNRQLSSLWDYYYGLEGRISILECDVYAETNCTSPETCPNGEACSECGSCSSCPNCGYCDGRYGYCSSCDRYYP